MTKWEEARKMLDFINRNHLTENSVLSYKGKNYELIGINTNSVSLLLLTKGQIITVGLNELKDVKVLVQKEKTLVQNWQDALSSFMNSLHCLTIMSHIEVGTVIEVYNSVICYEIVLAVKEEEYYVLEIPSVFVNIPLKEILRRVEESPMDFSYDIRGYMMPNNVSYKGKTETIGTTDVKVFASKLKMVGVIK